MKRLVVILFVLSVMSSIGFAAPLAQNEAYVLLNNLPLWQDQGQTLTWVENLTIGDTVVLLNRTAKFKQDKTDKTDKTERDFTRVRAPDGKEGWTRSNLIVSKASLAVVKADKAIVYSEPRDVKITSKFISAMTIVAVMQDGSTGEFAKVQAYDNAQGALFTDATFVSAGDLTTADADVNAVILYTVAAATKSQDIKKNLLKVAITKYGASLFLPKLQAASGISPTAPKETITASGFYVVNDNNVNVRSAPDETNGQVVTQVAKDTRVEVLEMTTQTYTVGGQTAAWFHIKDPSGWVFGSFLTPAQ